MGSPALWPGIVPWLAVACCVETAACEKHAMKPGLRAPAPPRGVSTGPGKPGPRNESPRPARGGYTTGFYSLGKFVRVNQPIALSLNCMG